jgi:hypothetical protein
MKKKYKVVVGRRKVVVERHEVEFFIPNSGFYD